MRQTLFELPPAPPTPPPAPIPSAVLKAIQQATSQPALYVMAHSDRSAVKIGGVECAANAPRRLRDVARHHARRLETRRWTDALPLELLVVLPIRNPAGAPIWPGDGTGLLSIEHRVRDVISLRVGPPAPWWEWLAVRHEVDDSEWRRLLIDAVRRARKNLAAPPADPMGLFALAS